MNADLKDAFSRIKPICDVLMVCPSPESIGAFVGRVTELKKEVVQELQQYLLFPLITHLKSSETDQKEELQRRLVDAMELVLGKVTVNSFEMCMKMELGLLQLVFDHTRPGMISEISEELKLSVMRCLTALLLSVDPKYREVMLKAHVPLLGKAVYVSVHIAKLEKLRSLRLAAINCVTAHTATHPQLTSDYHIASASLEKVVVDMLSLILPGVLGALQDVATSVDNPGHALVVSAIDAMHRILCLAMNNKFMKTNTNLTAEDFAKMIREKENKEVSKPVDPKSLPVRSPEWFAVAGEKLLLITKSLVSLRTHEHFKVRKELAVYCSRLLFECNIAMQTSVPLALDALICLAKDDYPEVSEYCTNAINTYFATASEDNRTKTLDALCENFFATLNTLPRVMNNIDSNRKLSSLNLVHGYIKVLSTDRRPQRLTCALSVHEHVTGACTALAQTVATQPDLTVLTQHAVRDITSTPPLNSPWCKLRHLDSVACERRFQDICQLLGAAECADLVLDRLLDLFRQTRDAELVYMMNWMCTAPNSSPSLIRRILNTYIEEDVWYSPLEVSSAEPPLSDADTMDLSVYNPRSWHKDTVPDLYEGAVETRYTDISYSTPRVRALAAPNTCSSVSEAQRNMLLSCLLTEGLGVMATTLQENYQPFLLKTLCLVLERVGSKYEMLHLSGLKAITAIARACGHDTVAELIRCNADYFTNQVTVRLKKAWNCQSALQILSVVMEYSDSNILNYLYGIVQDVLVQSCDKYYEKDLYAYLQVFLTFVECIRKWYMIAQRVPHHSQEDDYIDVLRDTREYIDNVEEGERLLDGGEFEQETGKTVEEMYREDMERRDEEELDYDDTVTKETPPPPQYVSVTVTILKRCLNYVASSQRDNTILCLQVLNTGLPILREYEDELLPLVHLTWAPLVSLFESEPVVVRRAFDLLVTMAELSRDFIRSRAVKEVLPHIYKLLQDSSSASYLQDVGSVYRAGPRYSLQVSALAALAQLVTRLALAGAPLHRAMAAVLPYLSNKQPKPLQSSAIEFFKRILDYDYGAAWYHLRQFCHNDEVLQPPAACPHLAPVAGTPYSHAHAEYDHNVKSIFNYMVS
ncbi:telo2 interacting protein 1 isoform X2 [Anticarsia gemmatalis]|uniref:telo2 interacting protein 1 isoform X2 n=1 Tax=Anticarsia gemmatalis TaxID=129554 RepID=UPI003F77697C